MEGPLVIAHRGCHTFAPENTIASFKAALEKGADMVELDVRLTRDNIPVIFHDRKFRDASGRSHITARLTENQLRGVQLKYPGSNSVSSDYLIPTLDEVQDRILPDLALNIELKPDLRRGDKLVVEVLKRIPHRHQSKIIFSSFSKTILRKLWSRNPKLKLGYLFRSNPEQALKWAKRHHCFSVHPNIDVCSESFVGSAQASGLKVIVWTVNDKRTAWRLLNWEVFGIITDNLGLFRRRPRIEGRHKQNALRSRYY
ncbi:MAG: glycerophosphodiester phosphodiesterase [Candidatus Omnitrophica bacterium]|nr:glycerophosphodiester phosphodiesterase [Candidatus Omnitrophota bacterium]